MQRRAGQPPAFRDGVITALVAHRRQGDRIAVHLDQRFVFDLAAVIADRAGLRAGDHLSAERQRELYEQDAPYRARDRAVRLLSVRDRSRSEVEIRLRQAGFEPDVVAETLTWLSGLGYVDDRRFAATYAAEKRRVGWGARHIRAELAGKGVGRSIADEVLAAQEESETSGSASGADEGMVALEQTVRKRFAAQFVTDPEAAERRLAGFLARRGYDWDTVGRLSRMLRAESEGTTGSDEAFDR
jgi:regulatory protein